ncbi:hypothetical protein SDC9_18835 [bioreactor metagenome]|uniref:Uncharacterized protein n=1 Tax=bioreactor metagenome TaxID=1076179 RepID=A0A644U3F2_9ZZZZ
MRQQAVRLLDHVVAQRFHVRGIAGQDRLEAVVDELRHREPVVARIGEPFRQQRQLVHRGQLVRILRIETVHQQRVRGPVRRDVAGGQRDRCRPLAGGGEPDELPRGPAHLWVVGGRGQHRRIAPRGQRLRRPADPRIGAGDEIPAAGLRAVDEAHIGGRAEEHAKLARRELFRGIGAREVLHPAVAEDRLRRLERLQPLGIVHVQLAVLDHRHALAPHRRLQQPVARDVPVPEQRILPARRPDRPAGVDHLIPALRHRLDPGRAQDVHVVKADRGRDRERQTIDLPAEGRELEHRLVIARRVEAGLGGDIGIERFCDAALDQDRLPVQCLEGHVRQGVRNRLAQDGVRRILVILIGGAERHLDVRMRRGEGLHDPLEGRIEDRGIGIGHLDLDGAGALGGKRRRKGKRKQVFHGGGSFAEGRQGHFIPLSAMPSMKRRCASRKATTRGVTMTVAVAIIGP